MRRLIISAMIIAAAVMPAEAQHGPSIGDSTVVSEKLYATLFEGVALDSVAARQAKQIILRTFVKQAGFGMVITQGTWLKVVALQEARDSSLAALLPSAEERAKFAVRARRTRPRHHFWSWPEGPDA